MVLLCFMLTTWSINKTICLQNVLQRPLSNCGINLGFDARNGENRPLLTDEPVEFDKYPDEVQGFKKITADLSWIYGI